MDIKVEDLARMIAKELEEYVEGIEEVLIETIDEVAAEALYSLKTDPIVKSLDGTGEYAKSFYSKLDVRVRGARKGFYRVTLHNHKYRIGHLLQYGHAMAGGGRTRAFPHWDKAQRIADTLEERIKEVISR